MRRNPLACGRVDSDVRVALAVPAAMAVLAACSGGGSAAAPSPAAGDQLVVRQDTGAGTAGVQYTLRCSPPGGDHPRAAAACAALTASADPFRPLPADRQCTLVFGGPDRASVTGSWRGRPVDLQLSRTDGCHIAQWDALGPLLDRPVGAPPPS